MQVNERRRRARVEQRDHDASGCHTQLRRQTRLQPLAQQRLSAYWEVTDRSGSHQYTVPRSFIYAKLFWHMADSKAKTEGSALQPDMRSMCHTVSDDRQRKQRLQAVCVQGACKLCCFS